MKQTVYLKLTTLPQEPTEKLLSIFENKYRDYKELGSIENTFFKDAGLNPLFGRIYSVTLAYVDNNTLRTQILKGDDSYAKRR